MNVLLAGWEPVEVLGLAGIICGCVVLICIAESWSNLKKQRLETDFKRELLDRGVSIGDIERLSEKPVHVEELAQRLGTSLASVRTGPQEVEEIMAAFQSADVPTKQNLVNLIESMAEADLENEEMNSGRPLAAARGLCGYSRSTSRNVLGSEVIRSAPLE